MNSSAVVVARWGRPSRSLVGCGRARSKRPLLAMHDPLGEVAQGGVARPLVRAPGAAAARAAGLLPDDLAPQQQPEAILQDGDDVGRQRAVGLATEVGDVDRDAPAGLERADALGEDRLQHLQVLEIASLVCGLRRARSRRPCPRSTGGEVTTSETDEAADAVHRAAVAQVDLVDDAGRLDGVVVAQDGGREPGVEVGRVVVLAPGDAERRGGGPAPALGSCGHGCQPFLCRCWSLSCCHTVTLRRGCDNAGTLLRHPSCGAEPCAVQRRPS